MTQVRALLRGSVRRVRRHLVNVVSNALPDDHFSCLARALLYRSLGCRISLRGMVHGGGYLGGGKLTIEDKVFVNRGVHFDCSGEITIKTGVAIGPYVQFITGSHEIGLTGRRAGANTVGPIIVGENAWIGQSAIVQPGVNIGARSVVNAGAVVTRDVPENAVVAGVPARVIRMLPA